MTTLHVHFALRNQQAFQRLLDVSRITNTQTTSGPALSTSGGRSWNKPSPLSGGIQANACDVNARDRLGRTVLHLAVSSPDPASLELVKLLLSHPRVDVNLADSESRWTPLHRALYAGNIPACVLLLQRGDIDVSLKDFEGYTAFDVYNSTVEGTKPSDFEVADLFTWGTNRNAVLGVGDGDDRTFPELVPIPPAKESSDSAKVSIRARFQPIRAKRVAMAKLHTAVITSEPRSNLRICGFGSGGRLGAGIAQYTQYAFAVPKDLTTEAQISTVALGQDHTLALTTAGSVLSWGLNRFSQLGYALDAPQALQATPRRIVGPLRKESAVGIAACRTASACWTREELFTWGTNGGQLGYDRSGAPVQIIPRRVTQITIPAIDVALSDTAMAVLLSSRDVHCFHNGRSFKINFPTQKFPSEIQAYRPPMAQHNASIAKVVSCDNTFAALSSNGEVFTFTISAPPHPLASSDPNASPAKPSNMTAPVKPQRVWALRKQISAVKDVALGSDGTILLCTESGHVYVRSRTNKTSRFVRVPLVQRVVAVSGSSAGAFAALKAECKPTPINIQGNSVAEDLSLLQPYLLPTENEGTNLQASMDGAPPPSSAVLSECQPSHIDEVDAEPEDSSGEAAVKKDAAMITRLIELLEQDRLHRRERGRGLFVSTNLAHGADLLVRVDSGFELPVHRVVLAFRSPVLKEVLLGNATKDSDGRLRCQLVKNKGRSDLPAMTVSGVHPLSTLMLVVYLYSDEIPAIWDRRVLSSISDRLRESVPKVNPANVHAELQKLAALLQLPALADALNAPVMRLPAPRLVDDLRALLDSMSQGTTWALDSPVAHPLAPDTVLELEDAQFHCHSVILRARSPFFAAFLDDPDWTVKRRQADCTLSIGLGHRGSRVMEFVLLFIYSGGNEELFDVLDFAQSPDDVLQFLFEVMDAAGELLLDRLVLICSSVILHFLNINNACYILSDASHFNADQLITSVHGYLARNLETLLESRMLDDLPMSLVRSFAEFVRARQAEKLPVTRSGKMVEKALDTWKDWLALQDIPQSIIPGRKATHGVIRHSPKLPPQAIAMTNKGSRRPSGGQRPAASYSPPQDLRFPVTPPSAPVQEAVETGPDDIFVMDDIPPLNLPSAQDNLPTITPQTGPPSSPEKYSPWKARVSRLPASKLDLRAIMAEAEDQRKASSDPSTTPPTRSRVVVGFDGSSPSPRPAPRSTPQKADSAQSTLPTKAGPSSPWRIPVPKVDSQLSRIPSSGAASSPAGLARQKPSGTLQGPVPSGLTRDLRENQVVIGGRTSVPPSSSSAAAAAAASPAAPSGQGTTGKGKAPLGPTFTPTRQAAPPVSAVPIGRKVSEGTTKAWNTTTAAPPSTQQSQPQAQSQATQVDHTGSVPNTPPPPPPPSFLAIQQQQQQDQTAAGSSSSSSSRTKKKSLLEIQAEEQARVSEERAMLEEMEFMRWWAAEEERIRRETQGRPGPPVSVPGSGSGSGPGAGGGAGGVGADGGGDRKGRRRKKDKAKKGGEVWKTGQGGGGNKKKVGC